MLAFVPKNIFVVEALLIVICVGKVASNVGFHVSVSFYTRVLVPFLRERIVFQNFRILIITVIINGATAMWGRGVQRDSFIGIGIVCF